MALQESGQMYIEAIYVLLQRTPNVRSVDVAEYLQYSKPSVSRAVGLLKKEGLIRMDDAGYLQLTEAGLSLGKQIYERHTVLTELFVNLGVDRETAVEDACRIEHYISEKTFSAVKEHMRKYGGKNGSPAKE